MAGPAAVIVAGAVTMTLAFTHKDEVVAHPTPAKAGAQLDPGLRRDGKP